MKTQYRFLEQDLFEKDIDKYFGFLVTEFGYTKIPQYQYVREIHTDFIKDNLIIKLIFEGNFSLCILKARKIEPELLNYSKTTVDYDYNYFKRYNLEEITKSRNIYNSFSTINFQNESVENYSKLLKENPKEALKKINSFMSSDIFKIGYLWYYSRLLKRNSEILKGDLSKFSWKYKLLKKMNKTANNVYRS